MAAIKSPKIYDPYLGEMYGNILDQYDNPTYNIRLYMKSESGGSSATSPSPSTQPGTQTAPTAGQPARSDQPNGNAASETRTVADKKIVILAQTGVTGTQIDNLEIESGNQTDASGKALKGSFTILQPGAANFLDQIQWARAYLGTPVAEVKGTDFYLYLDINFLGYDSYVEEDINKDDINERGGEPLQITDTVTYKIRFTSISVSLNNAGSNYDIQFAVADTIGFADEIYKTKSSITIQGSTITELLRSFEAGYNRDLSQNSTLFSKADQIEFNLDALLTNSNSKTPTSTGATAEKLYIREEIIPSPATDQNVELTTIPIFNGEIISREEQQTANDGEAVSGATEVVTAGVELRVREGSTIYTVIAQVLSMNKEFQSYVSRKQTLDDPGNDDVDDNQTFVAWFDVHCEIQTIEWDKKRNKYAKKYIYTPYLIEDIRSDVALTTKETSFLSETIEIGRNGSLGNKPVVAIATKRLQDLYNAGVLHKSYFYLFTGLNDQIVNLDIKFEHGTTLLLPPKGGVVGDYSVTNRNAITNSTPAVDNGRNSLSAAENTNNRETVVGLFNKIKGFADDIKTVADTIGRSPTELAGILRDSTGKAARDLAQSLDSATVNRLATTLGSSDGADPADTRTTNTDITVTTSGPYSPEVSGFLYAEDFIQPGGALTQEEISAAGLQTLPTSTPAETPPATPTVRSVPSPLSGITSDGPASTLMGYAYRARESSGFLLEIDLTLRGDPYWLSNKNSGKFEYGKPTPDRTTNPSNGKKMYFLLTIGSPRSYDFDVSDEDNNTGYWSSNSTSGVFSGLYYPTNWKNRFSGGIFTTEIKAAKEVTVPLQYIRRVLPGETPPAWDEILKGQDVDSILRDIGLSNDQLRGGAGGDAGGDGDGPSTYTPVAGGQGAWTEDQPFLAEVDRLARKYNIDANDLLGMMHSESGIDPGAVGTAEGGTRYVGLIQFSPDTARSLGTTQEALLRMSRAEQMVYVEKHFDLWKLPQGATPGHLYTSVYLPAYTNRPADFVLARSDNNNPRGVPNGAYSQNRRFDQNNDGQITIREVGQEVINKRKEIGL
jgi:hypothetical protein